MSKLVGISVKVSPVLLNEAKEMAESYDLSLATLHRDFWTLGLHFYAERMNNLYVNRGQRCEFKLALDVEEN